MYAAFEEEHGLAKRAMAVYDRATQVVNDEDKFGVCSLLLYLLETQLILSKAVHHLYRESSSELRSYSYKAHLRTRP